jgi:hypothetical protein
MSRQKNDYNTMNNELSKSQIKMNKIKEFQNISNININILSNYTYRTKLLIKIYPFIILLLMFLIVFIVYKIIIKYNTTTI